MIVRQYEVESTQGDYLVYAKDKTDAEFTFKEFYEEAIVINIYRNVGEYPYYLLGRVELC